MEKITKHKVYNKTHAKFMKLTESTYLSAFDGFLYSAKSMPGYASGKPTYQFQNAHKYIYAYSSTYIYTYINITNCLG